MNIQCLRINEEKLVRISNGFDKSYQKHSGESPESIIKKRNTILCVLDLRVLDLQKKIKVVEKKPQNIWTVEFSSTYVSNFYVNIDKQNMKIKT